MRDGISRAFAGGWYDKYPPGVHYLLAVAYLPALVAEQAHRVASLDPHVEATLYLQGRLVSLACAMGVVVAVMLLATRVLGRRHAAFAGIAMAASLPLVYYAKTANVDAAYVFLVLMSFVFLAGAQQSGGTRQLVGFGVCAALAVSTKDQAYGLYVLPAGYVACVWRTRPRALAALALAAVLTFAACQNLLFNWTGFTAHVQEVSGPASADYREHASDPAGLVRLFLDTVRQLVWMVGYAGVAALGFGVYAVWKHAAPSPPAWLWLSAVSYWATFLAVVGYSYDRFLLPILPPFVLLMAVGLGWLFDRKSHLATMGARLVLIVLVLRVLAVDVVMIADSRYAVERWLHNTVPAGAVVATYGNLEYLPRLAGFRPIRLSPGIEETEQLRPDFIVVNADFARRDAGDPVRAAWLTWLGAPGGSYEEVLRHKTGLPRPLRRLSRVLLAGIDDPHTNLGKIDPEMVVFRRRP